MKHSTIIALMAAMVCGMGILSGCMPSYSNAQHRLEGLLNSDEGQQMTADKLACFEQSYCKICLPVTDADTRPQEHTCYYASDTGTTMEFDFSEAPDTLNTIGTVNVEWRESQWGIAKGDSAEADVRNYFVQSRGKGIYSFYYMDEQTDSVGNVVRDADGLPLTAPFWEGMLIYVYPGADSLIVTRGSRETDHVYRLGHGVGGERRM